MHPEFRKRFTAVIAAALLLGQTAMAGEALKLRVTGDNVSVRAKSSPTAEVVGKVNTGDILDGFETEGDWRHIALPSNINCWVAAEFVNNGVTRDRVNARSGPGRSFSSLGVLDPGTTLVVRDQKDKWLRIVPPAGVSGWISSRFVAPAVPPQPAPTMPQPPPPPTDVTPKLQPQATQGQTTAGWEGIVATAGLFASGPAKYRLVKKVKDDRQIVCYLRGNNEQLDSFKGRAVRVQGREYWLKETNVPLVVPETIVPLE